MTGEYREQLDILIDENRSLKIQLSELWAQLEASEEKFAQADKLRKHAQNLCIEHDQKAIAALGKSEERAQALLEQSAQWEASALEGQQRERRLREALARADREGAHGLGCNYVGLTGDPCNCWLGQARQALNAEGETKEGESAST